MPNRAGRKKTVLLVSHNPQVASARTNVLESAGYSVIIAASIQEVTNACGTNKLSLVVIGHSLPPAEKRRVFVEIRKHCKVPVLELYDGEGPELLNETRTFSHHTELPDDFLQAVDAILRPPR